MACSNAMSAGAARVRPAAGTQAERRSPDGKQVGGGETADGKREAVMADVAAVAGAALAIFLAGALFMLIAVVAAGIRLEDKATLSRKDRKLRLRRQAPGQHPGQCPVGDSGVGQRVPGADSEHQ